MFLVFFTLPISGENLTYGDPATTIVNIVDDDTPGMTVTPRTLDVDEGATATYTVKLNGPPTGNVTVDITSNNPGAATVSPASLTFTSTDWNTAKTVMVTGVEDSDMNDEFVTLSNDPSGANYDSVSTVDVKLNVTDNDSPGVNVSKTALTVREEDTTGNSYTLVLNNQPTADVTVKVAGHSGTNVTPSPTTLFFTPPNWETAQTVTVTAANDADTTNDVVTLTHSATSADTDYHGITIASVAVTVTDNDSRPPTPGSGGGGGGGSGGGRSSGGGGGGGGSSNRPPEITGPKSLQYPEHSTEPVATYEAEDPEGTEIRWEIEDSDSEHFRISDEGVLRFITPPDYENPVDFRLNNTYEIRLLAFDSGSPSRSDRLQVRIEIKRVNELDPINGESQASIAEDHSGPIGQYQAEDPEGDAIAWSLTGPDAALFQIDEAGTLSLNAALDFEALGSAAGTNDYALTVVATDDGRDPVSQQLEVTVTLTDVNEEPISIPVPIVELTEGNLPTTLDLSEFFTDPDGDSLTYTLGDAADSNVASAVVEDSTLSITPLEDGTASFLVTATDPAGLSAAGTVEVSVVSPPPPEPTPTPTPTPTPDTHTHTHTDA